MSFLKKVPVLLGPTASGKTSLGIQLATSLNAEIISVDSRKVYQGLPIGTATPKGVWKNGHYQVEGISHHLMGFLPPSQPYTAGDFSVQAEQLINEIHSRAKTAILVGGTGFYFKALHQGLPKMPPRDESIRQNLMSRVRSEGLLSLHDQLRLVDPEAASAISSSDTHKIVRALEVWLLTKKPFSVWKSAPRWKSAHQFIVMGLRYPKELLEQRIEERSTQMELDGMVAETKAVLDHGYKRDCPALSSFGYREAVQVLCGELPASEFLPRLIKGTKAYAKRQMTWFRTQVTPTWFDCDGVSNKLDTALKMKGFIESNES